MPDQPADLATLRARLTEAVDRLRRVDLLLECEFGGFYLSAPPNDPLAKVRDLLRTPLAAALIDVAMETP